MLQDSDVMPENAIKVLDHGFVSLVDHMGNDLRVINAARVSFGKISKIFSNSDAKLLNYLAEHKHLSPFRHAMLTFHVKAPEFIMRQWYKHVVGCEWTSGEGRFVDHAWNEISGRYAEYEPEFYIPESFRPQSKDNKQASTDGDLGDNPIPDEISRDFAAQLWGGNVTVRNTYENALTRIYKAYKDLIAVGVAKEQARCLLPVSFYTEIYWTCSLQAAVHFIKLRQHAGAQYEIQEFAKALDVFVSERFPVAAEALKAHV
jgi:thymidylate synthase (FAD)